MPEENLRFVLPDPAAGDGEYVRRFLPVGEEGQAVLLLPLDDIVAARYALRRLLLPRRRWKVARNRLLEGLIRVGAAARIPGQLAVASTGPPFLVAAAADLGVPADAGWLLRFGEPEFTSRHAFHLFEPGREEPSWVLKFDPSGGAERFAADERGLALAQAAGGHVPRLVGRFRAEGVEASLETAGAGSRLLDVLAAPGGRAAKLRLIDRIAAWIVELGRRTRSAPEPRRVEAELAARAPAGLVGELPPLPGVLRHGNLGTMNVVVDGQDFTVLDWETAVESGFPLWDLAYLLADSFAHLDGAPSGSERERHFVALFRGELPSSRVVLDWIARGAEATEVPPEAVGRVLTLGWLEEARVNEARLAAAGRAPSLASRLSELWLSDPALGPRWAAPTRYG